MSKNNETLTLSLALLVTVGLLGGGGWWAKRQFLDPGTGGLNQSSPSATPNDRSPQALTQRLSWGERTLFPGPIATEKQAGIEAIAAGDYDQAVQQFEAALQQSRNDPEALIYLNNARIQGQETYAIAISLPIDSDPNAALEMLRGIAQAQDEINQAGGIQGVPLAVLLANDGNDPEVAKTVAQALVEDPSILGVVGHYASDVTLSTTEIYNQGALVAISPVSTSVQLTGAGDYIFRTVPSDYVAARALADYMLTQRQAQTVAVFYNPQSAYSQSLKSEFVTAVSLGGGQVTQEFDLSDPQFNAVQAVDQATQAGAEVLALLPNSGTLNAALQVVQNNRAQLMVLGGDDVYSPTTLEGAAASGEGMVVAVPWHVQAQSQTSFPQTSRQLWGGDVNWRTAMTYDAAQALIAGLSQSPSRTGVQQALRASGFAADGATGKVSFLPSGDRNQAVQLVTIQAGSRSGFGFDFVPIP
jgi:branched-chain amino acid transport system substrate-binding protein